MGFIQCPDNTTETHHEIIVIYTSAIISEVTYIYCEQFLYPSSPAQGTSYPSTPKTIRRALLKPQLFPDASAIQLPSKIFSPGALPLGPLGMKIGTGRLNQ